jgi:hypothetical protein
VLGVQLVHPELDVIQGSLQGRPPCREISRNRLQGTQAIVAVRGGTVDAGGLEVGDAAVLNIAVDVGRLERSETLDHAGGGGVDADGLQDGEALLQRGGGVRSC